MKKLLRIEDWGYLILYKNFENFFIVYIISNNLYVSEGELLERYKKKDEMGLDINIL